MKYFH